MMVIVSRNASPYIAGDPIRLGSVLSFRVIKGK